MSLNEISFKCNFCGDIIQKDGVGWCYVRLGINDKLTYNTLFSGKWVNDPCKNINGTHICNQCAKELALEFKEEIRFLLDKENEN